MLSAWLAASFAFALVGDGDRFALARVELVGPLRAVRASAGDAARAEWLSPLAAGERITVSLALPILDRSALLSPPEFALDGEGRATFLEWRPDAVAVRDSAWEALPPALRSRPRPTPGRESRPRVPMSSWWLASAAGVAVLALRRRPGGALAVGCLGGLAASVTLLGEERRVGFTRIVEIDGDSGQAIALDLGRDSIGVSPTDVRWESAPDRAPLSTRTIGAETGAPALELEGAGVNLRVWRKASTDGLRLDPGQNGWGLLSPVWLREGDGAWREFGLWPAGLAPSADSAPTESAPPGWLNPALPLGRRVIVGRWRDPTPALDGESEEVWVRWVGP